MYIYIYMYIYTCLHANVIPNIHVLRIPGICTCTFTCTCIYVYVHVHDTSIMLQCILLIEFFCYLVVSHYLIISN